MKEFFGMLLFGVIFVGVGYALVTYKSGPELELAGESTSWPTAEGKITTSRVTSRRGDNGRQYSALIEYRYEAGDETHTGDRVWFGDSFSSSSRAPARKQTEQYRIGDKVEVYYNPDDPGDSVLQPGVTWTTRLFHIGFWGMVVLGVALLGGAIFKGVIVVLALVAVTDGSKSGPPSTFPSNDSSGAGGEIDPGFVENID